jgi:hypothetical protein
LQSSEVLVAQRWLGFIIRLSRISVFGGKLSGRCLCVTVSRSRLIGFKPLRIRRSFMSLSEAMVVLVGWWIGFMVVLRKWQTELRADLGAKGWV